LLDVGVADLVAEDNGEFEDEATPRWDLADNRTPASATATTNAAATPRTDTRRAGPRLNWKFGEKRILEPLFWRVTSPA
jgi:hypothetical protein